MVKALVPSEIIENKIYLIRGKKVLVDKDLAELYKVTTSYLNRQVRRNLARFPEDFMIQLTREEFDRLMCHFGISKKGGTRKLPLAFTEQGIAMLSGILNSPRAIQVNIAIMRAFVRLRELMMTHKDLARKIEELEKKYDNQFKVVFEAIRQLMTLPPEPPRKKIGFHAD